jgi:hypothetical protein
LNHRGQDPFPPSLLRITSGLLVDREQSRSLPTSRLIVTDLTSFPEAHFGITSGWPTNRPVTSRLQSCEYRQCCASYEPWQSVKTSFTSQSGSWKARQRGRLSNYFLVACTAHSPGLSVIPTIDPVASRSMCRRSSRGPAISNSSVATGVSRTGLPTDK